MVCAPAESLSFDLTPRQREILLLKIREGMSEREIALYLRISPATVHDHMAGIRERLPESFLTGPGSQWDLRLAYALGIAVGLSRLSPAPTVEFAPIPTVRLSRCE